MDSVEIKAYRCENCGTAYLDKIIADQCCTEKTCEKICADCGCELPKKSYYTVCESCREKRRYNKCRKMTIEEYEKEFPNNMVIVGDDIYYSSVQDALECCCNDTQEILEYVYGTEKCYSKVIIDGAVENAEEDAYEDASFANNAVKELQDFVDKWNEENAIEYYEEAKIVIDVPEELRREYIL